MDIRYSPYQSPFVPSSPKGVYWIGAEMKNLPHNAHVFQFQFELARRRRELLESDHIGLIAEVSADLNRPFLSVCGCPECFAAARQMVGRGFGSTLSNGGLLSHGENFDDVLGFGRAR
jgi:hypothetical protein